MDERSDLFEQNQQDECSFADDEITVDSPDEFSSLAEPAAPARFGQLSSSQRLSLIERALQRLNDGSYGFCLSCGAAIEIDALQTNPAAETCQSCKSELQSKVS